MTTTILSPQTSQQPLAKHVSGARAPAWWGMMLLICTEAMLFASLIASYFFLRFQAGLVWPPDGIKEPELELPLIMSVILWSSSVPVHLAERAVKQGNARRLRLGLFAGFVLGAVFLGLQVGLEYPEVMKEFTPTTDVYGSLFFTLTGFHGLHVLVGLLFSLWVQVRAGLGAYDEERHVSVENFTLYWHFVDAVWLFILTTIYLSPHL
jgi:cytochrome c oxidase subunit III